MLEKECEQSKISINVEKIAPPKSISKKSKPPEKKNTPKKTVKNSSKNTKNTKPFRKWINYSSDSDDDVPLIDLIKKKKS